MGIIRKKIRNLKKRLFFEKKRKKFTVDLDTIYTKEGFTWRDKDKYYQYAESLEAVFKPKSLIDLGCANGFMLEYFHNQGMRNLQGFEGAHAAFECMSECMKPFIQKCDLRMDMGESSHPAIRKTFDVVNCTEVGEHIPVEYEEHFITNVIRFVDRILILSWSDEWEDFNGLDGTEHVNPRTKKYIKRKLASKGLLYDTRLSKEFVSALRAKKNVFDHWIRNIMVFSTL